MAAPLGPGGSRLVFLLLLGMGLAMRHHLSKKKSREGVDVSSNFLEAKCEMEKAVSADGLSDQIGCLLDNLRGFETASIIDTPDNLDDNNVDPQPVTRATRRTPISTGIEDSNPEIKDSNPGITNGAQADEGGEDVDDFESVSESKEAKKDDSVGTSSGESTDREGQPDFGDGDDNHYLVQGYEEKEKEAALASEGGSKAKSLSGVFFAVMTSPDHTEERDAIRETWMKKLTNQGASYKFFIGGLNHHHSALTRLQRETIKNNDDVALLPIGDGYYNLSRKTSGAAWWVERQLRGHNKPWLFVKVDDDVYPSVESLSKLVNALPKQNLYLGRLRHNVRVERGKHHKWRVPYRLYKQHHFPDYAEGPLYMMTADAMGILANNFDPSRPQEDVFPLEDVKTALLLQRNGIHPQTLAKGTMMEFTSNPYQADRHMFMLSHHEPKYWIWKHRYCPEAVVAVHAVPASRMYKVYESAKTKGSLKAVMEEFCPLVKPPGYTYIELNSKPRASR
ncbi:hypothetical protein AAMO2058_001624700 [Amorphochlora amoebiformis]